jgi:hypothetical protein
MKPEAESEGGIYYDMDCLEDYNKVFDAEVHRQEFEINAIRQYLGKLEVKYFNLTGEHIE